MTTSQLTWRRQTAQAALRRWLEMEMANEQIYELAPGWSFKHLSWRLRRPRFPQPDTGFTSNTCVDCDCYESIHFIKAKTRKWAHLYPGARSCRCGQCDGWLGFCLVCRVPSPTAYTVNRTRSCRDCRRYIKHMEKELWRRNLRIRDQRRDLQAWQRGAKSLRQVRRLLNPEPLKSPAEASELALTSQTS